jgi:hypothetical protein
MAAVTQRVEATLRTYDTDQSNTLSLSEINTRSGLWRARRRARRPT